MLLLSTFFVILVTFMTLRWRKERQKYTSLDHLPGPKPLPILGNATDLASTDMGILFKKMRHWASSYKDIYVLWVLNKPIINIYNPDDIEAVLSCSTLNIKSFLYDFSEPWLFRGLLTAEGSKWQARRKMLTPAFHFNVLKAYCESFEENSTKLVANLQNEVNNDRTDIRSFIAKYSLDTICETAMGTKLDDENETGTEYISNVVLLGKIIFQRISCFWLQNESLFTLSSLGKQFKSALKMVHGFTLNVIKRRRDYVTKNGSAFTEDTIGSAPATKKRLAMLDLLLSLEKDGKIDTAGIHEEVETFMFAGHETTFVSITYLLMLLANNDEYQNRVYDELTEVFGTSLRRATIDELHQLTFLGACVKETLRMFPSAPLISRLISHDVQLKSCLAPEGTTCNIHILDLHRRADLWEEPLDFRPERFTNSELSSKRHPFSYVPFSAGIRNCIGQKFAMLEIKSAAAAVLRNYRLLPVTRPHEVLLRSDSVLRPHSPVYIHFQPRHI